MRLALSGIGGRRGGTTTRNIRLNPYSGRSKLLCYLKGEGGALAKPTTDAGSALGAGRVAVRSIYGSTTVEAEVQRSDTSISKPPTRGMHWRIMKGGG